MRGFVPFLVHYRHCLISRIVLSCREKVTQGQKYIYCLSLYSKAVFYIAWLLMLSDFFPVIHLFLLRNKLWGLKQIDCFYRLKIPFFQPIDSLGIILIFSQIFVCPLSFSLWGIYFLRNLTQRVERLRKFLLAYALCFHKINRFYSHNVLQTCLKSGSLFLAHLVLAPSLLFVNKHQGPPR